MNSREPIKLQDMFESIATLKWGVVDFRPLKRKLFSRAMSKVKDFKPTKPIEDAPIQLIDFFSGAGGTSLAIATINRIFPVFRMLGGCDINKISATSYSANYGTPLFNDDVTRLAYDEGAIEKKLLELGFDFSKPTVLIGCAPCQGFSSHRKKDWGEEEDRRNNLIHAFMEIVRKVDPFAVIMENVPEFLSNRYWDHFAGAYSQLRKMGYIVKDNIYNAAEFGVPQERFRSLVMAMKKDFLLPDGLLDESQYHTVRDAIGDLPPVAAGELPHKDVLHRSAKHKQETLAVIRAVPHDGGSRPAGVGPKCLDKTKGFSDVYGRLYWDRPSITITHYARNPASGRYTHPVQDRGLTAREAARLQSFPDEFVFSGKMDDVYRQIGEAVPPLLALGFVVNLLVEMLSSEPTAEQLKNSPQSIEVPVSSSYSSVIAGIKMARRRDEK